MKTMREIHVCFFLKNKSQTFRPCLPTRVYLPPEKVPSTR